ncbi:hypothetical protein [Pseudomonas brassicacearum]|uniref:Uncharacterized protein n=1 Tax=Pseudomonas brassicacearum TaxID=930166 RepID=A0AAJ3G0G4_9PSED|nr:hypothetical protein [Pseudomonas brassicacearum]NUT84249.1 hypothetical protein [Pseudomonas brassicacearum]
MTQWKTQGFWSKAWTYALLVFLVVFTFYSDATWLGDGPSKRKRIFSPGFIAFCALVAVFELIALNHFYGASG